MLRRGLAISTMAAAAAAGSTLAQPGVSDPSQGRELANSLCSSCHQIEPGSEEGLKTDVHLFRRLRTVQVKQKNGSPGQSSFHRIQRCRKWL